MQRAVFTIIREIRYPDYATLTGLQDYMWIAKKDEMCDIAWELFVWILLLDELKISYCVCENDLA